MNHYPLLSSLVKHIHYGRCTYVYSFKIHKRILIHGNTMANATNVCSQTCMLFCLRTNIFGYEYLWKPYQLENIIKASMCFLSEQTFVAFFQISLKLTSICLIVKVWKLAVRIFLPCGQHTV